MTTGCIEAADNDEDLAVHLSFYVGDPQNIEPRVSKLSVKKKTKQSSCCSFMPKAPDDANNSSTK